MAVVAAALVLLSIAAFFLSSLLAVFLLSDGTVLLPPSLKDVELSEIRGLRQREFLATFMSILEGMGFSQERLVTTPGIVSGGRVAYAWLTDKSSAALLTVTPRNRSLSFLSRQGERLVETTNESTPKTLRTRDGRERLRRPELADPALLLAAHRATIESGAATAPDSLEAAIEQSYKLAVEADVAAGLRKLTGRRATPTLKGRWRCGRRRIERYLEESIESLSMGL